MPTPAEVLGLTGAIPWKLQLGVPGKKGIQEVQPKELSTFDFDPWFLVRDGWVRVRVQVNAGTTSGSKYPRNELRQMTAAGKEAAWDSKTLACWFEYELQLTRLPAKKPQMCVLQLHDDKNDLLEVIYQRNSDGGYEFTQRVAGSSKGQPVVPHALNKPCVLALGIAKGVPTIYRDGVAILTTTKMPQSTKTYAKLLNYLQSNTTKDAAAEYGEILARNVRTGLGAYPGLSATTPATPVPAPAPVPVPAPQPVPSLGQQRVLVIRHGEKPTSSRQGVTREGKPDSHSLTPDGWARAGALVRYFLGSDLTTPTAIYASQGATASRRPSQTVTPLAEKLGLPVEVRWDTETPADFPTFVAGVKAAPGVVLVALEHSRIPTFIKALGGSLPFEEWPDRWDLVAVLTPSGTGYSVALSAQRLMAGDRDV